MAFMGNLARRLSVAAAGLLVASTAAIAADTVRIGVDFNILGAQVWVAQEKGIFEKNGITAEIKPFAFGIDTIDAALTGQLDFGLGLDFATTTRLQSGQLKIVSAIIEPEPGFHKLAVAAGIAKPEGLAGKTIGIARGTAQHLVTIGYLQNFGVADATLTALPSLLEIVASLRAGRIDAAFVWGDGVAQAKEISGVTILGDDKPANVRLHGYISTTNGYAGENPQAVVNTLKSLAEATDWMEANWEEAVDIVAAHAKSPKEVVAAQMKNQHYTISLKPAQVEGFDKIAEFALANEIIKAPLKPRDFIDPSFLRQVDAGRVTLAD
jgi:ABC-type nitrate/sulfonate/bicarbonate transport system substrate-binding protein